MDFEYSLVSSRRWHENRKKFRGLMKYSSLLPILDPQNAVSFGSAFEEPTPLYRSQNLGKYLGLTDLWLKDETKNFTKTFKARDAVISVSRFQEIGLKEFVLCSTGNTAAAFCYAIRFARLPMTVHLFFPKGAIIDFPFPKGHVSRIEISDVSYQETLDLARQYSEQSGVPFEGGFRNPCRREGSKTLALEVAQAGLRPDWYVQAIGSGTGAYAFYKGFFELQKLGVVERIPNILCAQPEGCAPIVNAFKRGCESLLPEFVVSKPLTFASSLTNGNPSFSYPYVRSVVVKSGGRMEKVSESEIGRALVLLTKSEGILVEPAAAVALAGLVKCVDEGTIDKHSKILLNVSGGLRKRVKRNIGVGARQQHPFGSLFPSSNTKYRAEDGRVVL